MITTSVTKDEQLRTVLREAVERFNNELMDDEERLLLLECIKKLRKRLALKRWPILAGILFAAPTVAYLLLTYPG